MSSSSGEQTFVDWFKARGGTVHDAVGFKQSEGQGRGCVALQDIEVSSSVPSRNFCPARVLVQLSLARWLTAQQRSAESTTTG